MLISENLFFPIRTHFLRPSTPLQYSCLENPMDGGAWWAVVHGVTKSRARLSGFPFTFQFHALEKAMATHSSVLAWRIPGMGEPGGLPSMGLHGVGHNWGGLAAVSKTVLCVVFLPSSTLTGYMMILYFTDDFEMWILKHKLENYTFMLYFTFSKLLGEFRRHFTPHTHLG